MDANLLKTKFFEITRMKYAEQAKWFLNGFWNEGAEAEVENVWKCTQKFIELDEAKKGEGNELDEFWSHKFLESLGETLTVIQLRERLRKIDMDANGKMALMEYLLFKYKKTVQAAVNSNQVCGEFSPSSSSSDAECLPCRETTEKKLMRLRLK